jgi:hypothetical protein
MNSLLTPWIWIPIGITMVAATWWGTRGVKRVWLRALLTALPVAFFFTPFIPHSSVEWSTPWPPAVFWLFLSLSHGKFMSFEVVSIGVVTIVSWIVLLALLRKWTRTNAAS